MTNEINDDVHVLSLRSPGSAAPLTAKRVAARMAKEGGKLNGRTDNVDGLEGY